MPPKKSHRLGCFQPAVAVFALALILLFSTKAEPASFDFVDTPMADVARSLSLAYDTPILVDSGIENRVTFHLDGVGVLEGLVALCESQGLELVQAGNVFHVRRRTDRGENYFQKKDSLVSVSVRNKDVHEFLREFGNNSGLNIVPSPRISGQISGNLNDVSPEVALRVLMSAHGFRVYRDAGCFRVDSNVSALHGAPSESVDIVRDGDLYSANLNGAPLQGVLGEIARLSGLNLAVYGDVQETVRVHFANVPLEELIRSIFRGSRYDYTLDSASLYVSERGAKNTLSLTRLYPLKHVHAEKALAQLSKWPAGSNLAISEVKEQNALLLAGSAAEIESAISLLQTVDVPAMQVTLSCIIVELKRGKNFEIGLRGGSSRKTAEGNIGFRGFYDFLGKDVSKSGAFGKIGMLPDRFELELSSLEEQNKADVLARPRLTTLNGNKAELNVTNTVYYLVSQVSADGYPITDYRSFNDGISLELTPSVTQSGSITLEVSPEIKTAGRSTGDGPRDISTRNLKTTVVLKNGETLCLGGLRRKNKTQVRTAVPFLGSIPVVGKLFSYLSEDEDESELAIFITPEVSGVQNGGVSKNSP